MRAICILYILIIIILNGCATVEIAKEVTKATNSVKTTIKNIASNEDSLKNNEKFIKEDEVEEDENFIKEKEEIVIEKKKQEIAINKQKEIVVIDIHGKTLNQLTKDFGKPNFIREDSNTKSVRYDILDCRLFIYFDLEVKKPKAEYYEIRNTKGDLIEKKEYIEKCFKEIQKT